MSLPLTMSPGLRARLFARDEGEAKFDPHQPRDLHTGEWIRGAVSTLVEPRYVSTPDGRRVRARGPQPSLGDTFDPRTEMADLWIGTSGKYDYQDVEAIRGTARVLIGTPSESGHVDNYYPKDDASPGVDPGVMFASVKDLLVNRLPHAEREPEPLYRGLAGVSAERFTPGSTFREGIASWTPDAATATDFASGKYAYHRPGTEGQTKPGVIMRVRGLPSVKAARESTSTDPLVRAADERVASGNYRVVSTSVQPDGHTLVDVEWVGLPYDPAAVAGTEYGPIDIPRADGSVRRTTGIIRNGVAPAVVEAEQRLAASKADASSSAGLGARMALDLLDEPLGMEGKFDPHQRRDSHGRWTRGGGTGVLDDPFDRAGQARYREALAAQGGDTVHDGLRDTPSVEELQALLDKPSYDESPPGRDVPSAVADDGFGGFGSEEGLRAAFETDLPGGFRSVVRDTTDPQYRGHGAAIEVNGKIVNARGEDVGYFERTLYPATGIVSHDSLAIAVSHRGKGLGAALVKHSIAAVEKAGYRKINVYAAGPGFVDDAKRPLTLSGWRMWARPDLGFRFDDAGREKVLSFLGSWDYPSDSPQRDVQRRFVTADRTKWPTPAEVYAVAPEALADGWSGERPLAAATKSYLDDGMLHLECIPGPNPDRHGSRVAATDPEGKAFDPNEARDEHGRWTRGAHSLVASIAPSVRDGVLAHQAAPLTPAARRYRVSTIERPAPEPGTRTAVFDVDETLIHAAPLRAQRDAGALTRQQQHAQALDTATPPVGEIVDAMRRAKEQGLAVVVATARPPGDRGALGTYFRHVGVPVDALFTRPDTNFEVEDDVVKRAMVGRMRALGWDPVVSFDDKPGNVAMFHDEGVPAVLVRHDGGSPVVPEPAEPAARTWVRSTNEFGQRISVMDTEHGRYVIDGNGVPSMRWSVTFPDGDYALGKTKREVLGEAEIDLAQRDREYRANNREGKSARRSIPNQAARTKLMDGLAAQDAEDLRIAEADVYAAIMDALERQERTVIARLTGTKARRHTRHWDPPGEAKIDPRYVLDLSKWRRELDAAVRPALQRAAAAGAQSVARRLGLGVTAGLPEADMVVQSGVQRIVTGLLKRFLEVQDVIAQGEASGLPMDGIEQAVRDAYKAKAAWAKRASSDETVGAYNAGSMERAQRSGKVFRKMWLSSRDEKVRATHRAADGQVVPVDGNFIVGGWPLQYPGDPTGPPREVFNCRCTLLYEARKV